MRKDLFLSDTTCPVGVMNGLESSSRGLESESRLTESPETGARLQHLRGGCTGGGGLEKVRVQELSREARPACCRLAKTAPGKQKTDDG